MFNEGEHGFPDIIEVKFSLNFTNKKDNCCEEDDIRRKNV